MFFRQVNASLTIDQIDLSKLSPPLKRDDKYFHTELADCISNAASAKDINALSHILAVINDNHADRISPDRVIDEIYLRAIARDFSPVDLKKLLTAIPVNINREIYHVFRGMCQPPELEIDSLLNLAVAFHRPELVDFLLSAGADVDHLSHEGETPEQELERILKLDRNSGDAYNVPCKERMLASIKSAKLAQQNVNQSGCNKSPRP